MWRKAEWCLNSRVLYFFVLDGVWREHKILIKNCCRDFARPVVWSTPRDKLNTPMAQGAETKFDRFSNTACGCTEDVVWCLFLFLSFLVSQFCILPSNTSNTHETASTSIRNTSILTQILIEVIVSRSLMNFASHRGNVSLIPMLDLGFAG